MRNANYIPTIDLWQGDRIDQLIKGALVLAPGQWVKCGPQDKPSRFCGVTSTGTIVAVHPHGRRGISMSQFRAAMDLANGKRRGDEPDGRKDNR